MIVRSAATTTNHVMIHSGSVTRARRARGEPSGRAAGREHRDPGDERRHDDRPAAEGGEEREESEDGDRHDPGLSRPGPLPERARVEVHARVRNHDERDDDEPGQEDSRDDGREVVEELLEAEEVPRRLRRVRGLDGIRDSLERRVEEERDEREADHDDLEEDDLPDDQVRERHDVPFLAPADRGPRVGADERDTARNDEGVARLDDLQRAHGFTSGGTPPSSRGP